MNINQFRLNKTQYYINLFSENFNKLTIQKKVFAVAVCAIGLFGLLILTVRRCTLHNKNITSKNEKSNKTEAVELTSNRLRAKENDEDAKTRSNHKNITETRDGKDKTNLAIRENREKTNDSQTKDHPSTKEKNEKLDEQRKSTSSSDEPSAKAKTDLENVRNQILDLYDSNWIKQTKGIWKAFFMQLNADKSYEKGWFLKLRIQGDLEIAKLVNLKKAKKTTQQIDKDNFVAKYAFWSKDELDLNSKHIFNLNLTDNDIDTLSREFETVYQAMENERESFKQNILDWKENYNKLKVSRTIPELKSLSLRINQYQTKIAQQRVTFLGGENSYYERLLVITDKLEPDWNFRNKVSLGYLFQ